MAKNTTVDAVASPTAAQLEHRLSQYAASFHHRLGGVVWKAKDAVSLSAVAGAACAATPAAEAAINYSGPLTFNTAFFAHNFECGGSCFTRVAVPITDTSGSTLANFYLSAYAGYGGYVGLNFGTGGSVNSPSTPGTLGEELLLAPDPTNAIDRPNQLSAGDSIGATGDFFSPAIGDNNDNRRLTLKGPYADPTLNWEQGDSGYVGVKFDTSGGNASHYGWVRLEIVFEGAPAGLPTSGMGGNFFGLANVIDWAYETTPDTPIIAGDSGLTPVQLPGDFNEDGVVDAADYTVWRDGLGTTFVQEDYLEWANNYGASSAPALSAAVPEPTGATVLGLGLLALGSAGLRKHRDRRKTEAVGLGST